MRGSTRPPQTESAGHKASESPSTARQRQRITKRIEWTVLLAAGCFFLGLLMLMIGDVSLDQLRRSAISGVETAELSQVIWPASFLVVALVLLVLLAAPILDGHFVELIILASLVAIVGILIILATASAKPSLRRVTPTPATQSFR